MEGVDIRAPVSRRQALALGGGLVAVGAVTGCGGGSSAKAPGAGGGGGGGVMTQRGSLPVAQIEEILQADGMDIDGVLTIEQDREDLHVTGPGGLPFKPAWELNNEFYFQPLGSGRAILNADLPLLPHETQPFIDRLLSGGLVSWPSTSTSSISRRWCSSSTPAASATRSSSPRPRPPRSR